MPRWRKVPTQPRPNRQSALALRWLDFRQWRRRRSPCALHFALAGTQPAAPAPGRTEPGSAGTGSTTFNPDAGKPPPVPADPEPAGVAALNRSARPDPTVTPQSTEQRD